MSLLKFLSFSVNYTEPPKSEFQVLKVTGLLWPLTEFMQYCRATVCKHHWQQRMDDEGMAKFVNNAQMSKTFRVNLQTLERVINAIAHNCCPTKRLICPLVWVSIYLYQHTDLARGVPEMIHICKTMFSATAKKSCLKDGNYKTPTICEFSLRLDSLKS